MQDNHDSLVCAVSPSEALHRAAARIDQRLDKRLAEFGLTSRQYLLLKCVGAQDGITQVGLSEMSGIDRSTMTDMVSRLVARNLLVRTKKASDARAYEVRLTEAGRQQLALAMPSVERIDTALLDKIAPHLRESFLQTIGDLSEWQD